MRAADEPFEDDRISDATWPVLARAFEPRQLLDVMVAVGGYRSTSMLINTAGVQLDANVEEWRFPRASVNDQRTLAADADGARQRAAGLLRDASLSPTARPASPSAGT